MITLPNGLMALPINETDLSNTIRDTGEALPRPDFVDHIEYRFGNDQDGYFSVWPYIILRDDVETVRVNRKAKGLKRLERTPQGQEPNQFSDQMAATIFPRYGVFPYTHFQKLSERALGDEE